jgi:nicotinate-nucleotide adenylyltransferase
MKIALYLGSFNPFHNGHLKVVKTALKDFKMDKVVIVPTMQNPWKEEKVLDIDERIKIITGYTFDINLDHAVKSRQILNLPIEISNIEKELVPPYYSYATLHALKNKYCNDEIFVLCGEDTINDIPDWMNGEAIIRDYNFIVVDRFSWDISSSQIRGYVKLDKDISKFVSPNVINLIKKYYK